MSITRRGISWLVSVSYQGNRIRRSFHDHTEARKFELHALSCLMEDREIDKGKNKKADASSFGEIADRIWQLEWKHHKAADHTFNRMIMVCEDIGDGTLVSAITTSTLEDYVLSLRQRGNGPATINRKMAIVTKVLNYAFKHGMISKTPSMPVQREPKAKAKYYSKEDEELIMDLMTDHDLRDLFAFLIDTGFRRSEALCVEWEDVDFQRGEVRLSDPNKNKAFLARTVPMTDRVKRILILRHGFELERPFHFTSPQIDTLLASFKAETGYDSGGDAILHTCRHTFCSRLVQRGVPILAVKELAGHRDMNTTLRYAHLAPSNYTDAIAKLNP